MEFEDCVRINLDQETALWSGRFLQNRSYKPWKTISASRQYFSVVLSFQLLENLYPSIDASFFSSQVSMIAPFNSRICANCQFAHLPFIPHTFRHIA